MPDFMVTVESTNSFLITADNATQAGHFGLQRAKDEVCSQLKWDVVGIQEVGEV